jgi:hypothetical protein
VAVVNDCFFDRDRVKSVLNDTAGSPFDDSLPSIATAMASP